MTPPVNDLEAMLEDDDPDLLTDDLLHDGGAGDWIPSWVGMAHPGRRRFALITGGACGLAALIASLAMATGGGNNHLTANQAIHAGPLVGNGGAARSAVPAASAGSGGQIDLGPIGATSNAQTAGQSGSTGPALPNEVPSLSTKVVKTGTLQLQVGSGGIPAAVTRISSEATGLSGFVASSSESTGSSSSGNVTLRVPVANYDALVGDAERLGKTLQFTSSGQDVTAQYVDLQARIQSLQTARTQFEQILAQAHSIGDILAVESQISDLQTQVEQLQGQFQVLDNQATYSTLTLQISEVGKPTPVPPKPASGFSKAWSHAGHSFTHGAESILSASGGIALFLVTLAALLLIGRVIWVTVRRRPA